MPKKGSKKFKIFFFFNKYLTVTHVSICIYQGLSKNIVLRSVTNKFWAILYFFLQAGLFSALYPTPYPKHKKKYFFSKNPLNYYSLKVTQFHGDNVKNESASTKTLQGAKRPPPSQRVTWN